VGEGLNPHKAKIIFYFILLVTIPFLLSLFSLSSFLPPFSSLHYLEEGRREGRREVREK
jgi:hypothetical protein